MWYEYTFSILHTKGLSLGFSRTLELRRGNTDSRCTLDFKPYRVMQTARGTGSSIR